MDDGTASLVLTMGKLYYPAYTHYTATASTRVHCDMCRATDLKICIGYQTLDLCLPCAARVANGPSSSPFMAEVNSGVVKAAAAGPRFTVRSVGYGTAPPEPEEDAKGKAF